MLPIVEFLKGGAQICGGGGGARLILLDCVHKGSFITLTPGFEGFNFNFSRKDTYSISL